MNNNKKVGLILLFSTFMVIILGILGYTVYEHQVKVEQAKLIKKSAKQIDEFYKWNYIGVSKTTTSKHISVNLASADDRKYLDYTVYFGKNQKVSYSAHYDDGKIILGTFGKDEKERPIFKVPEAGDYDNNSWDYVLNPDDISKLKKKGFTADITGAQIKQELLKLHPNHFKNGFK